ncbi:hypothetical protein ORF 634L [Red seabream iridovirus]|uniref:Uncharacterized protein ORF 634L n=1 Tax=Red sea bream iridovirus TaxID=65424 RepID=F1SVZ6_RSIV|nr:hypothetical protein ORF 634L [Red seabream iridovirus]
MASNSSSVSLSNTTPCGAAGARWRLRLCGGSSHTSRVISQ